VNHAGPSSQEHREHENLQTLVTWTGNGHGSMPGGALLVMATRFVTPVRAPCRAIAASDLRSELMP